MYQREGVGKMFAHNLKSKRDASSVSFTLYRYVYCVVVVREKPHHQKNQETIYRVSKIQRNQRPDGRASPLVCASVHGDEVSLQILHIVSVHTTSIFLRDSAMHPGEQRNRWKS